MRLPQEVKKIRPGQFWIKKDIGLLIEITSTHGDNFSYRKVGTGKNQGHRVKRKELLMFWQRA